MCKNIVVVLLFIANLLNAQSVDPLRAGDVEAQNKWVEDVINSMTIDEKIGQLFMVQAYSNKDEKHTQFISDLITKYHIGNLIFMQGTPKKQVELNNKYQSLITKVPLMIGFDGEWGLDMRLKNTYRFPWNMALGAIENNELLEQLGKQIGNHCKRVGIHINFAPVVDVNTNPNNPIIGNRSFGESKENVAQKAVAFTKGMQSVGVLANAKHFPGHGDTSKDSHHTLPTINFTEQRIDSIELYPFKKVFDAGIASVMTAHLSIPKLEKNVELPSSLSKKVVTDLLKNKLGFLGLIFTDGLNMKGAANYSSSAEINLSAILAGNDILLIPEDIPNTIKLFKESLKKGILTEERINYSVKKILRAKYLVGLNNYKPIKYENVVEELNTPFNDVLHRKLVENSITLLKNKTDLIPIKDLEKNRIAYVNLGDDSGSYFVNMLKNYTKITEVYDDNLDVLINKLKEYNLVIIGYHKSNKNPWKTYKFSNKDLVKLKKISKHKRVILDVFASPYSLLQIENFKNIDNIIVSYQNSKEAQELSAQAIFGAIGIKGKLPVSIKNIFEVGSGITTNKLGRLGYSIPEAVEMSSDSLKIIEKYLDTIQQKEMAPGGQVLVARKGKVIFQKNFGYHTYDKKKEVKSSDIYDIASITKILASLPMIMKAEEEEKFSIDSQLKDIFHKYKNTNKDTLKVKNILSHTAQLPAWIPFYRYTKDEKGNNLSEFYRKKQSKKYNIKIAENLYLLSSYKDSINKIIKDIDLLQADYKYSDLGYYIFKDILEKKYKKRLDKLVDENFYKKLGLNRTSYLPLKKFEKLEIVPTEKDNYYRNQLIHGYVHDMGSAMQGGVGGHAGVFSNANDIAKMMQMYLQKGYYGGKRYLKTETIDKFNKRYFSDLQVRRGLGFDKPQLREEEKATCNCVSDKSFGHSGFTGTYTWADPESEIIYVFLSNRIYPTMENKELVKTNMRTKIQQVIQNAIVD